MVTEPFEIDTDPTDAPQPKKRGRPRKVHAINGAIANIADTVSRIHQSTGPTDDDEFTSGPDSPNIQKPLDPDEPDSTKGYGTIRQLSPDEVADLRNHSADDPDSPYLTISADPTDPPLSDPALFAELDEVRIPKLESLGRKLATVEDRIKAENLKKKELGEEISMIMDDHGIFRYHYKDVTLLKSLTAKIKAEIG